VQTHESTTPACVLMPAVADTGAVVVVAVEPSADGLRRLRSSRGRVEEYVALQPPDPVTDAPPTRPDSSSPPLRGCKCACGLWEPTTMTSCVRPKKSAGSCSLVADDGGGAMPRSNTGCAAYLPSPPREEL